MAEFLLANAGAIALGVLAVLEAIVYVLMIAIYGINEPSLGLDTSGPLFGRTLARNGALTACQPHPSSAISRTPPAPFPLLDN